VTDGITLDHAALGLACLLALLALLVASRALRTARRTKALVERRVQQPAPQSRPQPKVQPKPRTRPSTPPPVSDTGRAAEVHRLRAELASLRLDLGDALRHLAVVRYDAFGDMGGHVSWSMALLDDNGNGVVLTSINGRSDARSYAKNVRDFECDAKLSPEEQEAIEYVRKSAVDQGAEVR
jgi:Protein of unknown function (DUF4446)